MKTKKHIQLSKYLLAGFVMTLAVVSGAATYTETVDGITWTYTVANGEASVGGGLLSSTAVPVSTSGAIVIPSSLGGYTVTSIGSYAFDNCQKLTNVTIPNGVTSISNGAFRDCRGLTNVTIPDSVTRIGNFTFYNCQKMTNVTIPNGVTSIGEDAFWGCSSLTSVTIPDGVTRIRDAAFSGCSGLTHVTIPDSVTSIESSAFYGCSGLMSVTIPDSVTSIESSAFYGCSGLMSVTIPDSVISIGPYVFCDCTKLTNVTIPDGVTSIGNGAFRDCSGLTNVTIPDSVTNIGHSVFYNCKRLTNATIPDGVTSIGDWAFAHCSGLTNVTIPDGVMSIGEYAFCDCSSLTSVTLPDGITSIGDSVFSNCNRLTRVTIPDGVTSIGDWAFAHCSGLTNVTIPNSVTSIGEYAFGNCSSLTNVCVDDLAAWCRISFSGFYANPLYYAHRLYVKGVLATDLTIPEGVTNIENYVFCGCRSLTSVTIPDSATGIGDSAFSNCSSLMSVTISDSVTDVGEKAFYGCRGLMSVTIPDRVTYIGTSAFAMCSNMLSVVLSENLTGIESSVFSNCCSLTSVVIPDCVTNIGRMAFSMCNSLTNVTLGSGVGIITDLAFNGCRGLTSLPIPNSVKHIGYGAFSGCSGLTSLTIPNSVTYIGYGAFSGCSALVEITLPFVGVRRGHSGDITSLFGYVFGMGSYSGGAGVLQYSVNSEGVDSWDTFYIPATLRKLVLTDETVLGSWALQNCRSLTDVTIPDSVTSIGTAPFYGCYGLSNVTVPQSVCTRGMKSVFAPSIYKQLSHVVVADGVLSIESSAFEDCYGLVSITIPGSVTTIGTSAFNNCTNLTNVHIEDLAAWCKISFGSSTANPLSYAHNLQVNGIAVTDLTIPSCVTSIGAFAFYGYSSLTNIMIPDTVIEVGYEAFGRCNESLFDVDTIPGVRMVDGWALDYAGSSYGDLDLRGARGIGVSAFNGCNGLTNVTIPNSVQNIGAYAFKDCSRLTSLTVPDSVMNIGYGAFSSCNHLTNVTLGGGVKSIAANAFSGCLNLLTIAFDGDAPVIGTNTLLEVNSDCQVYVRQGSTGWGVTIPGEWAGIVIDYIDQIVVFDANGGEGSISNVLDRGTAIVAPTATRTGYTFNGWLPNVDYMVPASNVTYTAQWTPNKYHVTFDANGGTGGWSREMDCDAPINAPTVRKTGYAFNGWLPDVDYAVPASNVTYTAQWVPNQYTVTFNANGGVGGMSVKQDYGTAIVVPTVTRTGYTFMGWLPSVAATVPAYNVTYRAQWELNKYTVTFTAGSGAYDTWTATINHGTTVGELPVPTRAKATFLGWFTDAEGGTRIDDSTVITEAMALYAHWLTLEEALGVSNGVTVATSADVPWKPMFDSSAKAGDATARSGEIGNSTNTWMSATVSGAGTMSFWCKVSCEHDDDNTFTWDRLMVYTNGVEVAEWRMDGETDWTRREVSFAGGENTVKWVYFKDRSVSEGEDCAWVDGVTWTLADVAVDVGGGKSVLVPMDWIDAHSNIVMAVGGDKSAAMKSTAANGRKVWECYVLGLDPEKTGDFKITSFPMKADGTPDLSAITFEPEQSQWNLSGATPKLKGKATLDAEWQDVPPGGNPSFRFFTVEVQMP